MIGSNNNQELFERIENYLLGKMNKDDRSAFDLEINSNPELKKLVEENKIAIDSVQEIQMKKKLEEVHRNSVTNSKKSGGANKSSSFRKIAIAAVFAAFIGLAAWLLFGNATQGGKLYAKHFELDPGIVTSMGSNDNYDLYKGMIDYKQGNFEMAIKRWEALSEITPKNDTLSYYLGVSYLATNQTKKAKKKLKKSSKLEGNHFLSEINLYLGLIELKENHISEAKDFLEKSTTNKAKEILSELSTN